MLIRFLVLRACTTSISQLLSAHPCISTCDVSVLTSSATVTHLASLPTSSVAEIIEDAGFECSFITSSAQFATGTSSSDSDRTITLAVEGMFCQQCVNKVNAALASAGVQSFSPIALAFPTTIITYTPSSTTNIRTLLHLLENLDSAFTASLVKPPSITSRAREIQAREARVLLLHFLVAFAIAIPTFVIAIVGMTVMKKDDPFRLYWEEPAWGGAGKGTVALFVLATIVQFGVGR